MRKRTESTVEEVNAVPENNNLWEQVGNECLGKALNLLKSETAPTAATAETVGRLVETAIAIDALNLRWAEQNRSCAAASLGQAFLQPKAKS